jgi:membrane-bound lytic murein transglycosylase D
MVKIISHFVVSTFFCGLILIFSACMSQIAVDKNTSTKINSPSLSQISNKSNEQHTIENKDQEQKEKSDTKLSSNIPSDTGRTHKDKPIEEEQDKMEKVLDLLEDADSFWEAGDVENTINTLDKAYALLLATNGNVDEPRQKDDLRLLVAKRILAAYSAQQTTTNGKASAIPLTMNADVEREIRCFQGPEREFFIASYQRAGIYRDIITKELKIAGIPEELFWLPLVESGFKNNALSRSRALGLWQFIPSTGYKFGLSRDEWIDERMDALKSTHAAIAYLKELHYMFGDWLTALAAYNCGEGRVLRVISGQRINYFDRFWDLYNQLPRETARYVPRFLATLYIINNPKKYGFDLPKPIESSPSFQMVKVNKVMKLQDISSKIEVSEEVMDLLNAELRYKITPDREYVLDQIPETEKPKFRTAFIRHRVRSGETIGSIARKYGVSASSITSYNRLNPNRVLVAGRRLTIPMAKEQSYTRSKTRQNYEKMQMTSSGKYRVRKGDALQTIAQSFGVSVAQIKELNNLQIDEIYAGQLLKISADENIVDAGDVSVAKTKKVKKSKITDEVLSAADIESLGTDKYIVTKGDNLYRIARKNNIDLTRLKELNNISDDTKIKPGQILTVK